MIKFRVFYSILICLAICIMANGQTKVLKVSGDYIHKKTNTVFPLKVDDYNRSLVLSYDNSKDNISVGYTNQTSNGKTTFTVFIYPAGNGTEGRLRNEFISSLEAITYVNITSNKISKFPIKFIKDGYRVNGLEADIIDNNGKSKLTIYECGLWFLKIRISSQNLDSLELADLENKISKRYNPINLVKRSPLNLKANIYFAKGSFADSVMLGSVMGSALKKIEWAIENVDSLERISGFPDLYLDLHKESLLEFAKFAKEHPQMSMQKTTENYLSQLNAIIDNGFLNEFIMEQFDSLMIVPKGQKFDFSKFDDWRMTNPIEINLKRYYAVLEYTK